MKDSGFVFGFLHFLYYKCHTINLNCGGPYIVSFDWIKNKKDTTNPLKKKGNKCFQYATAGALNHEQTGKQSERINLLHLL